MTPVHVTQPSLPDLNEFIEYLEQIWESKWLTNSGPFHQQLEAELCKYLGVNHICLFTNGTLALVTALQALGITGEVITTPYSFVATSHSLLWNNIKPVFVDIDEKTLNIDPLKIETAITESTTAILPVHCYGRPCDTEQIDKISKKYGLKVIYDAAHAFGVENEQTSILNYGDLSVLSFHATKVFNTFEGGAIVCHDEKLKQKIDKLKNFGFVDETTVASPGINGKMSEINAAFGLLQLKNINSEIAKRKEVDRIYRDRLKTAEGIDLLNDEWKGKRNYSYFPILVNNNYSLTRDSLYEKLKRNNIFSRRYFYPLISDFPMYRSMPSASKDNLQVAQHIADNILCLPIYSNLALEDQGLIIRLINEG